MICAGTPIIIIIIIICILFQTNGQKRNQNYYISVAVDIELIFATFSATSYYFMFGGALWAFGIHCSDGIQ